MGSGGVWARSAGAGGTTSHASSASLDAAVPSALVPSSSPGREAWVLKEVEGSTLAGGAIAGAAGLSGTSNDKVRTSLFNGSTVSFRGAGFG